MGHALGIKEKSHAALWHDFEALTTDIRKFPNAVWDGHGITVQDDKLDDICNDKVLDICNARIQQQEDKFDSFKTQIQRELEQLECKTSVTGLGSPIGLTRATSAPSLGGPSSNISDPTSDRALTSDPP